MCFFLTSLRAAEGSFSAGNGAGQQPATTDAVSYGGSVGVCIISPILATPHTTLDSSRLINRFSFLLKLGSHDIRISAVSPLSFLYVWPVFLHLDKIKHMFVCGHQATETAARQPPSEGDRQTDQGVQRTSCRPRSGTELLASSLTAVWYHTVFRGLSVHIFLYSVCVFSGRERYRKSAC